MLFPGRQVAAVLLVAAFVTVGGVPVVAQAPDSQSPSPVCFEIVRSSTDEAAAAILLNRCTGQSWILVTSRRRHGDQIAYRWAPIAMGEAEAVAAPSASAQPPAPASINPNNDKCFTFQGRRFCE